MSLTQGSFLELHGDRTVKDDKAMIGGLGKIGDQSYMFIGQQKGYNTKTRKYRNFGMANPEGYRKALRLMKSAEKFSYSCRLPCRYARCIPRLGS
jgi:acetyl-CoA carboxylase carboxyl transferase subunit alpha